MKKCITFFCTALLFFSLVSCTAGESSLAGHESSAMGTSSEKSVKLIPAAKRDLTPEEQKIAEDYYAQMIEKYPSFASVPREMLDEFVYQDEYLSVEFTFCLGGFPTDCSCQFHTSPRYPDGVWSVEEDAFAQFYTRGLTESELYEIQSSLFQAFRAYAETYKLSFPDTVLPEEIPIFWTVTDGETCAYSEYIASVTPETVRSFGCGDHAHIFASVRLQLSGEQLTLTPLPAYGS